MHYTRQELLDVRGSSAGIQTSNNVNETIDNLGIGLTVLLSSPVPSWLCTLRCKRLAKQSGLINNNLVTVPKGNISNYRESGLVNLQLL